MNLSTVGDNNLHNMDHRELTSVTPTDQQQTSTAERVNAWTEQADATLARIVLQYIAAGETQLKGFEQAGQVLRRTVAACGFRWNGVLRKQYRNEIEQAKRVKATLRSSSGKTLNKHGGEPVTSSGAMQKAIGFLRSFEEEYRRTEAMIGTLTRERDELAARLRELEKAAANQDKKRTAVTSLERIHDDAQTLVEILRRARTL